MFRILTLFLLPHILLTACGPGDGDAGDTQESIDTRDAGASTASQGQASSQVAFQLPERDLFPEGIAYDPASQRFLLGSLRKSKIISVGLDGVVDTLAGRSELGQGGILGLKVDPERRVLWANFHQSSEQLNADSSVPFRTGIHKIDLDTGLLLRSYSIEKEEENHLFNDIALASDGTVYITSYSKGTLYRIPAATGELEAWLSMPEGVYTNGIAIGPRGRSLFVAGNADVYRVEIGTNEVKPLEVPEGSFVGFGDGLYFDDGGLIIIASYGNQGRQDYHVARLRLSDDWSAITEIQVLDREHSLFGYPTTGALVDGWFYYIANAQFDRVDGQGTVAPWEDLSDTYILRIGLESGS